MMLLASSLQASDKPVAIDGRRELFVDYHLVDRLDGAAMVPARPRDEGVVFRFDRPWEGRFCGYTTILRDGETYRMYYRGLPEAGKDGSNTEVTCVAESNDGIHWTRPKLRLFEVHDTPTNNVVLADHAPFSHNFSPFLDTRPGVPADQRYKAIAGTSKTGLFVFVSPDGYRWRELNDKPAITKGAFDSQNVGFWSEAEQCYLCYFRTWTGGYRRISRTTSKDLLSWTPPVLMEYRQGKEPAPLEHLYTNQTAPYFRAPHLSMAIAARFLPGRQVISDAQAKAIDVDPGYFRDISDGILMSTRGGNVYDRTFMEGFVRPDIGLENWVSRTNYPVLGIVQTGPDTMSFYTNCNYGQPTACLRRYSLRLDGFASVRAPYEGGEMVTRPLTFQGKRLAVNFATSAAGGIRIEIQDAQGKPLPGFALADSVELIGNEISREATWKGDKTLAELAGRPVRLRFVLKDADLYAIQFCE